MTKVAINLYGLQQWFGGDFSPVPEVARQAEEMGIDMITITDHVVMSRNTHNYPYGPFLTEPDYPWFEPIVSLAAVAAATRKAKLSTGILISPLRSAVLLAKQLATLDHMSKGRLEIGFGVGWQKEEYDACGVPWEGRFGQMEEQARVCKLLWTTEPASFHGKYTNFDEIYCKPFPAQKGGVPIWFGLAPTERNWGRIVELGCGWIPMEQDPAKLGEHIQQLRAACKAKGRDPDSMQIRAMAPMAFGAAGLDWDATVAGIKATIKAGVTMVEFVPLALAAGPQDAARVFEQIASFKKG
jgi:probable F420-dependent oxidoreductase